MRLLLDTHIWLWSLLEPERLSGRVQESLRNEDAELWLSSISLWELTVLVEKGRLRFDENVNDWIAKALRTAPLREAPVSHLVVRTLGSITTPHRDPADRFIAATAAALDLALVTADQKLIDGSGYRVVLNE